MDWDIIRVHALADSLLKTKLEELLPDVVHKPDIWDVYSGKIPRVAGAPTDLQLPFYLYHFDEIKNNNFQVRKDQDFDLMRCIFYYQLDRTHALSHRFEQIRYNLILMVFVFRSPNGPGNHCDTAKGGLDFVGDFLLAWVESLKYFGNFSFEYRETFLKNWRKGSKDFVIFGRKQLELLKGKFEVLKTQLKIMAPSSEEIEDFWEGKMTTDIFDKRGLLLALKWCFDQEDLLRKQAAEGLVGDFDNNLCGFANLEIPAKGAEHANLSEVDWHSEIMTAILRQEEGDMQTERASNKEEFWMNSFDAVKLFGSEVDNITNLLKECKISKSLEG